MDEEDFNIDRIFRELGVRRLSSMPCNGAADGLAKAIVEMQNIRDVLDNLPDHVAMHEEWLEVINNHVTICVTITPLGRIEHCEVTLSVGAM